MEFGETLWLVVIVRKNLCVYVNERECVRSSMWGERKKVVKGGNYLA